MRKRLRKKLHLGEFQEVGFELSFAMASELSDDQSDDLFWEFLEEAIEGNGLLFGGVGKAGRWSGIVHRSRGSVTEEDQRSVLSWLGKHPSFSSIQIHGTFDLWYGEPSEPVAEPGR